MQDAPEQPQVYLITPPQIELGIFPTVLAKMLDTHEIACVRMALASSDESTVSHAADALREICHARDVAIVIEDHLMQVEKLGLDGVHLTDSARTVRHARKTLGEDGVVGAFCGGLRHDGMLAGENGADYVSFGPVQATPLGDGSFAEADIFQWWSEVIEIPVVAEGALDLEQIRALAPITDFFGIGPEIWESADPHATLASFIEAMG